MQDTQHSLAEFLPMIPSLLFWVGLPLYILHRKRHPVQRSRTEKIILRSIGYAFLVLLGFGVVHLAVSIRRSLIQNRIRNANGNAGYLAEHVFDYAVTELDSKGNLPEQSDTLYSGQLGGSAEPDSLQEALNQCWEGSSGYYVIETDGSWHVTRCWWSVHPITPDKQHSYTEAEQTRLLQSPFSGYAEAVGYCCIAVPYTEPEETT